MHAHMAGPPLQRNPVQCHSLSPHNRMHAVRLRRLATALLAAAFLAALLRIPRAAARALSAYECMQRLEQAAKDWTPEQDPGEGCISDGVCGKFPQPSRSFYDRLSPKCASLMEDLRSPWSSAGLTNLLGAKEGHACKFRRPTRDLKRAPMLISSVETPPFVACTVPKAGCSNVRKLLVNIATQPNRPSRDALGHYSDAHHFNYPGLWHYVIPPRGPGNSSAGGAAERRRLAADDSAILWQPQDTEAVAARVEAGGSESRGRRTAIADGDGTVDPALLVPPNGDLPIQLPEGVPSFTFGRNPYTRLLSGFRDKMVLNPRRADQRTRKLINKFLGHREDLSWPESAEGFKQFVRELYAKGLEGVNDHLMPMVAACEYPANLRYDFYLQLEQMEEWFPCMMDGLGIRDLTEKGWADTPSGRMYLGEGVDEAFITLRSPRKTQYTPLWNPAAGRATRGREGVDWDWVKGDLCWWAPDGMSCADYYASFTESDGTIVPGDGNSRKNAYSKEDSKDADADGGGRQRDSHDTDSQSKWAQFYDQETGDLVYNLYASDFEAFGYKRAIFS